MVYEYADRQHTVQLPRSDDARSEMLAKRHNTALVPSHQVGCGTGLCHREKKIVSRVWRNIERW